MDALRPRQFQRRKLLVVLVISTPLLARFPHSEHDSQMEERQLRLPFHRRPRPVINYNTIDKFKELSQAIEDMEKQAMAPPFRRHPTRNSASTARSKINAAAIEAPPHQRLEPSDMSFTTLGADDEEILQTSRPARRSRKRVVYDSDDEGDNIVAAKRNRVKDKRPEQRSAHLFTPPPSTVEVPSPSTPCPRRIVETHPPRKTTSERTNTSTSHTFSITVDPLTTERCADDQLRLLLRKYQASLLLGMPDLEQSILHELDTSNVMTFEVFRRFKRIYLEGKEGGVALQESSLGAWIQRRQAGYLFELTGVLVVEGEPAGWGRD